MKKLYPGSYFSCLKTISKSFILFFFLFLTISKTDYSQMCAAPPLGPGMHVSVDPPTFQWYVSIAGMCGPVVLGATTECPINSNFPPPYFGSFPLTDTCYLLSNSQWNSFFSLNASYCWGSHVIGGGYIWQSGGYPITRLAAVLPPVSLLFPANADTQISITPRIFWNRIDSANGYTLRVYSDACCITSVFDSTSTNIAVSVPLGKLLSNSRYYYRVKSYKAGGEGPFSDPYYFNTGSGQIPNLLSPHFNSEGVQLTPLLDWEDIQDPLEHRVQVSTDMNFNSVIADISGLNVSQYSIPAGLLTYNSVYYWRIASRTAVGWTPFSAGWNFKTYSIPDPVLLSYPANNSVELPTAITFTWQKASETLLSSGVFPAKKNKLNAIDAIDRYWFELTTDPVTMADLITDSNVLDTTKFISGLSLAKEYYWRVRAKNDLGWGEFSSWWKFTTVIGPPQAPALVSPPNNSLQQYSNLAFIWNRSAEITARPTNGFDNILFDKKTIQKGGDAISAYWFEITEDTVSMSGLLRDTTLTDTLKILNLPSGSKPYFWRVKAKNVLGWSVFSSWWKFITIPAAYMWEVAAINVGSGISAISFPNTSVGYLVSNNSGTAVTYKTTDGGSTWSNVSSTFMMLPNSMVFTTPEFGYIASGPHGPMNYPTWSTGNGGIYWGGTAFINYSGSNMRSVAATVEGLIYAGTLTTFGTIQYTYSAILGIEMDPLLYHTIPLNRVRGGKNNAWTVGAQGIIYRSMVRLDVGENVNLTGISFNDDNTGYAVGENKFFKSTNNGSSWFRLYPLTEQTSYNDVYFANKDTGWVACSLAGEGVVIGTSNGGTSWEVEYKGPYAGSEFTFVDKKFGWLLCGNSVLRTTNVASQQNPPPVLLQPADGATAQSLTPQLDWQDALNSVSYRIQLSADSLFTGLLIDDTTITASNYDVQSGILQGYTRYFWRVASKNTSAWSDFSQIFRFRTFGTPNAVTLNYPADNAAGVPTITNFNWFAPTSTKLALVLTGRKTDKNIPFSKILDQPGNYWFEITRDTVSLTDLHIDSLLTDTIKSINGLTFSTGYYWRVKAHNDLGWGEFSPWWKFTTSNGAPVLLEPVYNQTEVPVTPLLNWSDVPDAVKYRVQVSAYGSFAVLWIDDSSSAVSHYQVPPGILAYNSAYYWRVKTKNSVGWGEYQSPFRFFTLITPPPAGPVLNAPVDGSTGITLTPLLDWNDISGSTKYRLQISSLADFSSRIFDDSSITASEFTLPAGLLAAGTHYYWRAAVKGSSVWSSYSAVWSFTTISIPPDVILVSPLNNAIGQPLNIDFSWSNSTEIALDVFLKKSRSEKLSFGKRYIDESEQTDDNADKYWFELTTDTNTPAAFYLDSALTDTNKSIIGLNGLTTYYWRVKAGNAAGWSSYSPWWKFTTSSGVPPEPPVLQAPSNLSYDVPVTPVLDWSDSPGALKYRVQVSAYISFAVLWIDDSSSSVSQFQVSPGILAYNSGYYWRVKAKNDIGWGEYQPPFRFFTLVNPPPSAPVLLSPVNGASAVSLTPLLDWIDVSGSSTYKLQVSASPSFTGLIVDDSNLTVSGFTIPAGYLNPNTAYYWRAAAKNSSWGAYSQVWSFQTLGIPLPVTLLSPANNAVEQQLNPTLIWNRATESSMSAGKLFKSVTNTTDHVSIGGNSGIDAITGYWLELATDTTSQVGLLRDSTIVDTIKQVSGLTPLTTYYWRVKARNDIDWGSFSSWWKFTTTSGLPPAAPLLISPANGASDIAVTPAFDWGDSPGANKYRIQVSAYSSFAVLWIDDSNSSVSQFQVTPGILAYNSGYYWRVKAKNDVGWGNYQTAFRFFTMVNPPPAAPVLAAPPNGSSGVSLTPILDWNDVAGITKYRLQVSASPLFTSLLLDDSSITSSAYNIAAGILNSNAQYYWKVAAKNSSTWGVFSPAWNFRTISTPSQVVLISPVNNSIEQPLSLTFSWQMAAENLMLSTRQANFSGEISSRVPINGNTGFDAVQNYWFEICSDTVSMAGAVRDSSLTDTVKQLSGLTAASAYYWRVKAKNEIGWGEFSTWWKFTTLSGLPPAAPLLISPPYGAAEIPITPVFDWSDSPGAAKYRIQVSAYGNFAMLWIDDSSSTVSQFQVPPGVLAYNSGYYWRVKAKNDAGWGNYQSAFRFFTQVTPPPQPPELQSPPNGAINLPLETVLDWSDVTGAVKYRLQVSGESAFTTLIVNDSSIVSSAYNIVAGVLSNNTTYFWRVSVKTSASWSAFSPPWSFTTVSAVTPPVLRHPALRDTGVAVTTLFDWSNVAGAVKYRLQVSAYSSFGILWIDKYVTDTSYLAPLGTLAYNSRYFWRVKTIRASDSSGYSAAYNFFTKVVPTGDLIPVAQNYVTIGLPAYDLRASKHSYTMEICKDTLFVQTAFKIENVVTDSVEIPATMLEEYTTYFWRIYKGSGNERKAAINVFVTYALGKQVLYRNVGPVVPERYALYQNYPNPFNPVSKIRFDIPASENGLVKTNLSVYDVLGRQVGTLIDMELLPGAYEVDWNASGYPSGIYFYRFSTQQFSETRKMILLK